MGGHQCVCDYGFNNTATRTNPDCQDIDECSMPGLFGCSSNEVCHNTIGSYACHCEPGFDRQNSGNCEDIDECSRGKCDTNGVAPMVCSNSPGSFECRCTNDGYKKVFDSFTDQFRCENVNECELNKCDQDSMVCIDREGTYECDCKKQGWIEMDDNRDMLYCVPPMNACDTVICPENSVCINKDSSRDFRERSYVCECLSEFHPIHSPPKYGLPNEQNLVRCSACTYELAEINRISFGKSKYQNLKDGDKEIYSAFEKFWSDCLNLVILRVSSEIFGQKIYFSELPKEI